jgi:coupling of ubiquitin conjugation to ER degradation protein 1
MLPFDLLLSVGTNLTVLIVLQPPPSFQPLIPDTSPAATSAATTQARRMDSKPASPGLIQRYKLDSKTTQDVELPAVESKAKAKTSWSNSKNERQVLLQKRREEMILAARKKMMGDAKVGNS